MVNWIGKRLRAMGGSDKQNERTPEAVGPVFETLEERRLLSGDVSAVLNGTTLVLKGNKASNQIEITGDVTGVSVDALASDAFTPTTINGVAGPAVFVGVTDVIFKSKKGNNYVSADTLTLTGNLSIQTNKGFDIVDLIDVTIGGNTTVKTGKNSDTILVAGTSAFTGNLKIGAGGGNDHTQIHGEGGGDIVTVAGNTMITLGSGINNFTIFEGDVGTQFNNVEVKGGKTVDSVTLNSAVIGGALTVNTKGGDDDITVSTATIGGKSQFVSGDGDDVIAIDEVSSLALMTVKLGDGTDTVDVDAGAGPLLALHIYGGELDAASTGGNILTEPRLIGGVVEA